MNRDECLSSVIGVSWIWLQSRSLPIASDNDCHQPYPTRKVSHVFIPRCCQESNPRASVVWMICDGRDRRSKRLVFEAITISNFNSLPVEQ